MERNLTLGNFDVRDDSKDVTRALMDLLAIVQVVIEG